MFTHSRLDELGLMYKIFKRDQNTLPFVIRKMVPYIEARGQKIVKDETLVSNPGNPDEFTQKLLALKAEIDKMIEESFKNDMKFQRGSQ